MQDVRQLVQKLAKDFRQIKTDFDLDEKGKQLLKLEADSTDPSLWDDQEHARHVMQEFADLKDEIEEIQKLEKDINTLQSLSKQGNLVADIEDEVKSLQKRIEKLKLGSFLSGPYDKKNALLGIHAGQGGTEAMDWASMLYRMYLRFCEKRGWKTKVADISEGEEAGIKSVIVRVRGSYAYGYLKNEAGTHRLVRQSPFNADKLRQTSFALVEVMPELAEVDLPDIKIKEDDLKWQFFRASSQGGQNVQKVSSAVRVKHVPTGITTTAQTERHQEQNRKLALDLLRAKLWLRERVKKEAEKTKLKGDYKPASWGTQIRSYVLHPYKMVKDLRTQVETSNTESVLDGELDRFIEAELKLSK
jgi:peptide chain release factor 2